MANTDKSFFRRLSYVYKDLYLGKGYNFDLEAEKCLLRLISFVQSGVYVKGEEQRFVAARWMLPVYDICRAWNSDSARVKKAEKTFYSIKSRLGQKLERIFPYDLVKVFMGEDNEGLAMISATMSMYRLCVRDGEEIDFAGMFGSGVESFCVGDKPQGIALEDCKDELAVLAHLNRFALEDYFTGLNRDKLAYLWSIFSSRLFMADGSINLEKLQAVRYLDEAWSGLGLLDRLANDALDVRAKSDVSAVPDEGEGVTVVSGLTAKERFGFTDMEQLAAVLEKWSGMQLSVEKFRNVAGKRGDDISLLLSLFTEEGLKKYIVGIYPQDLKAALYDLEQTLRRKDKNGDCVS